jgi:hypothetical protein
MTTELQRVMARYEDARIEYKKAVLSSLKGDSRGEAIRQAIRDFQTASAELKRVTGKPVASAPRPPVVPHRLSRPLTMNRAQPAFSGFSFLRSLLSAG